MEAEVQSKKLPGSLRTARRGTVARTPQSEPGSGSDLKQKARVRTRQTNMSLECAARAQWKVQVQANGQPGNRGVRHASRKTDTKQQQWASTSCTVFLWLCSYQSHPRRAAQGRGRNSDGA